MAKVVGFDDSVKKKVTCRGTKGCGAIIEYFPGEVKSKHGTDYGGGSDGMEYLFCPNCGEKAVIRSW